MTSSSLKKELHKAIDGTADKGFLKAVYAMFKEYNPDFSSEYEFSIEEKKILDNQKELHINGRSKSFSVSEVRKQALARHRKR